MSCTISLTQRVKVIQSNMQGMANTVRWYNNSSYTTQLQDFLDIAIQHVSERVDMRGSLSWTDFGGIASTHCQGSRTRELERVVQRDILTPLLGLLAALSVRSHEGVPMASPLNLQLLRGAHLQPLVREAELGVVKLAIAMRNRIRDSPTN